MNRRLRVFCCPNTSKLGYCNPTVTDGKRRHVDTFITPSGSIGEAEELAVFQNSHAIEPAYLESGTVDEWRDSVATLAVGNSRLVFALAVAFASALAEIAGENSGGFHLRGASSSGKSTALKLAASVWGNSSTYVRLWRGTVNGLEGLATLHNDGLLISEEIQKNRMNTGFQFFVVQTYSNSAVVIQG